MPSLRRVLLVPLALAALGYAALAASIGLVQDSLVFPGAGRGDRPVSAHGVRAFTLAVPSAEAGGAATSVRAVECRPERPAAVLVHFVGNGETLSSAARSTELLSGYGIAVVSPEYPGYGQSPGSPSVAALLAVADAAADHAARLAQDLGVPLLVSGSSLGTFCAVHVAATGKGKRLLLHAPPTTLAEVAATRFWWLPVGLLLRHRFDSLSLAPRVRCPVLVVHGEQDGIVPVEFGRRLCAAFPGPAELVAVPGAGHNDLPLHVHGPVGERVRAFLLGP